MKISSYRFERFSLKQASSRCPYITVQQIKSNAIIWNQKLPFSIYKNITFQFPVSYCRCDREDSKIFSNLFTLTNMSAEVMCEQIIAVGFLQVIWILIPSLFNIIIYMIKFQFLDYNVIASIFLPTIGQYCNINKESNHRVLQLVQYTRTALKQLCRRHFSHLLN